MSIDVNGKYYSSNASDLPPYAESNYGYLDVICHYSDSNYRVIKYTPITTNVIYQNVLHNGTWTGWEKLAKQSSLSNYLPLSGGTLTGGLNVPYIGNRYYLPYVDGGHLENRTGKKTGYIKITLPTSWMDTMIRFTVSIHNHVSNVKGGNNIDYIIGGYPYSGKVWLATDVYSLGNFTKGLSNLPVIFSHDGTKCAIYIGTDSTEWCYTQVRIHDVIMGYNTNYDTFSKGWKVEQIAALDNGSSPSTITHTNPNIVSSVFSLSGTTLTITTS